MTWQIGNINPPGTITQQTTNDLLKPLTYYRQDIYLGRLLTQTESDTLRTAYEAGIGTEIGNITVVGAYYNDVGTPYLMVFFQTSATVTKNIGDLISDTLINPVFSSIPINSQVFWYFAIPDTELPSWLWLIPVAIVGLGIAYIIIKR